MVLQRGETTLENCRKRGLRMQAGWQMMRRVYAPGTCIAPNVAYGPLLPKLIPVPMRVHDVSAQPRDPGYIACMTNPFDKAKRDEKFEGSPDDILSAAMIAELLGCRRAVLDRLCNSGELKAKRVGNRGWRTTRRAVMAYLESGTEADPAGSK